jgi:hypothetical protein
MQHFYDGQIRRYITQMIRMLSNFGYQDIEGNVVRIPVTYGDLTRQVANIMRDNSENKIPSAPRMAVYITGLEIDRSRTADQSFVSKLNIRERKYDSSGKEYLDEQGKNYTVERLMPTPYTLSVSADLWSTNTDQKLQILEQILVLFNPSLEIQTTDNYIDWASLTVVNLEGITYSSRSVPVGIDSEIDIATLQFQVPIYLSAPVKVKRLGVITNIIQSIFHADSGEIDLQLTPLQNTDNIPDNYYTDIAEQPLIKTNYQGYGMFVDNTSIQIISKNKVGAVKWDDLLEAYPGQYSAGISRIYLTNENLNNEITGTFALNELDTTKIVIDWDLDSLPTNSVFTSNFRDANQLSTIDAIVDPLILNPIDFEVQGYRFLITNSINNNTAWNNLVANTNDIIEYNGTNWYVLFDSEISNSVSYVTNTNTGKQYYWSGEQWLLSIEGEYSKGNWRLSLDG